MALTTGKIKTFHLWLQADKIKKTDNFSCTLVDED